MLFYHASKQIPEHVQLQRYTVKWVDGILRHPDLVTQKQFIRLSEKVSDVFDINFAINIETFPSDFNKIMNLINTRIESRTYQVSNLHPLRLLFVFWYLASVPYFTLK